MRLGHSSFESFGVNTRCTVHIRFLRRWRALCSCTMVNRSFVYVQATLIKCTWFVFPLKGNKLDSLFYLSFMFFFIFSKLGNIQPKQKFTKYWVCRTQSLKPLLLMFMPKTWLRRILRIRWFVRLNSIGPSYADTASRKPCIGCYWLLIHLRENKVWRI